MYNEQKWTRYGEYSFLPCSKLNSVKLKALRGFSKGNYPHIVNFAITWKCNSMCRMCNIWKEKSDVEIPVDTVKKIFSDELFRKTKLIKITGGEPTLHTQLPKIIEVISKLAPEAKIAINTNGYPFERIKRVVDACLEVRDDIIFSVALDGIGETHNYVRGRECYQDVVRTIDYLEELKRSKNVLYRFSFTITPWNYTDLPKVVELARERRTYVGFRVMHIDKLYRNVDLRANGLKDEIKPMAKKVGENYFQENIGSDVTVNCFAFVNSVFIDPQGKFHPCLYREEEGNGELSKLWTDDRGKKIRDNTKKCARCWSDCQTIPNIIANFGEFK